MPGHFRFLELPLEIRYMIYEYTVVPTGPVYLYQRRHESLANDPIGVNTGLLKANKQIYYEAEPFVYKNRQGIVGGTEHVDLCLQNIKDNDEYYARLLEGLTLGSQWSRQIECHTGSTTMATNGYIPGFNPVTISKFQTIIVLLTPDWDLRFVKTEVCSQTLASILNQFVKCLQASGEWVEQKIIFRVILKEYPDLFMERVSEDWLFRQFGSAGIFDLVDQIGCCRPSYIAGHMSKGFFNRFQTLVEEHLLEPRCYRSDKSIQVPSLQDLDRWLGALTVLKAFPNHALLDGTACWLEKGE